MKRTRNPTIRPSRARRKPGTADDLASVYFQRSARPLYALALVVPLMLFVHIGTAVWGYDHVVIRDGGILDLLRYFGVGSYIVPPLAVIVVLGAQHVVRKDPLRFKPWVLGGMVVESVFWALPLVAYSYLRASMHPAQAGYSPLQNFSLEYQLVSAVGAGVYEEFLFRMVGIGLIELILTDLAGLKEPLAAAIAVLVTALAFSAYHFWPSREPLQLGKFLFLASAGVLWGAIRVTRSYALAVGAHVAWNLYFVLS